METQEKRRRGRPIEYEELRKPVTVQWPVDLIHYIDAHANNRTKWLIEAAREKMQREQER